MYFTPHWLVHWLLSIGLFCNSSIPHRVRKSTLSDITALGSCDCPGLTDLSGGAVMLWCRPGLMGPVGHVELDVWKRRHLLSQSPHNPPKPPAPPPPPLQCRSQAQVDLVTGVWRKRRLQDSARLLCWSPWLTYGNLPLCWKGKGDWHGHLCRTSHLLGESRQRWWWGWCWRGLTGPYLSSHTFYRLIINAWALAPRQPVLPSETSY